MFPAKQVVEFLLDCHGGTIDVTFTPVPKIRLEAFLQYLWKKYRIESASDNFGDECASQLSSNEPFANNSGFIHAETTTEQELITRLQIFIDWETDSHECRLEISFFPDEIDPSKFTLAIFRSEIDQWQAVLQAEDYFVRQENASWKLYDSKDLGVIYTLKLPPLD